MSILNDEKKMKKKKERKQRRKKKTFWVVKKNQLEYFLLHNGLVKLIKLLFNEV